MSVQNVKMLTVKEITGKFKKTELYALVLVVPLVIYVIMITGNYTGYKVKPLLIDASVITILMSVVQSALRKRKLRNFTEILNNEDYLKFSALKGEILSFPAYSARIVVIRWLAGLISLLSVLSFQIDIDRLNFLSVLVTILLIIPFSYFLFYICIENIMAMLLSDPRMTVINVENDSFTKFSLINRIFLFVSSVVIIPLGVLSFFLYLITTNQLVLNHLGYHLVFIIVLAGLCLVVSLYEMAASTGRSIMTLGSALEKITAGDLMFEPVPMFTANELGNLNQYVNALLLKLRETVDSVKKSSDSLFASSKDINMASYTLSSLASEQAAGMEEISSTMEEMLSSVSQNADISNEAENLSQASYKMADEGTAIVNNAVTAIDEVKESSRKIANIITLLNDIAFQTNLLALNASVEAARAGDSGRGFAVVASEVRNLAQRARAASDEISQLIKTSVDKVNAGTDLVNKSGSALKQIFDSIEKTKLIISEINSLSKEQKTGLGEITQSLNQTDMASQQTAAAAEQLSSTADQLKLNSEEMQQLMSFFKV